MLNDATCFKKIFIVTGYTDLRSGIDRLADTIRSYLGEDAIEADTLYLFCGRTHDSSQKAGETIEKSTGLYFVTFMHNVEISDCFPSGKRSLPFLSFFVFWKP